MIIYVGQLLRIVRPLGLLLCWTLVTKAEAVTTVFHTGPSSNRVDLVFLGDGYQAHELPAYHETVAGMVDYLFHGSEAPFHRYRNYFNVHQIDLVSVQSGAAPQRDVVLDTALGASYGYDEANQDLLYIDELRADAATTAALAGTSIVADASLVAVNAEDFGGGAGDYAAFAAGHISAFEIALHELAHAFNGLTDEYVSFSETYHGLELEFPNVTNDSSGGKWEPWLGYVQPGIGVIGAYEGGHYLAHGVYRPSANSKMRTLGQPFDVVAREEIVLDIYDLVDPLDSWREDSVVVRDGEPLWVEPVDDSLLSFEWLVGAEIVAGITGPQLDYTEIGLLPGTYFVGVRATDNTDWVRRDRQKLAQQVFWVVQHFPGDFDDNQIVDVEDIETLTDAIKTGSQDTRFDLDDDGFVTGTDRDRWLQGIRSFYGDADLDGEVGFPDFLVLSEHFGASKATWREGDFDLEEGVGFADFLLLANNFGMVRAVGVVAIPEPAADTLAWTCACLAWHTLRRIRRSRDR